MSKPTNYPNNPFVKLRQSRNLTQHELAERSGIGIRQIQKIEAGSILINNVTLKNAASLASAFEMSIDDFYCKCK